MLKFLDKPMTWKGYILFTVTASLGMFLVQTGYRAYREARGYDIELNYLDEDDMLV